MINETPVYQLHDITVTTERVVIGDEVIPVASIVSASLGTSTIIPPLAQGCLGAFCLLMAVACVIMGFIALQEEPGPGVALLVLGGLSGLLLFIAMKFGGRRSYFVIVNTAAGSANSASSRDGASMRAAVNAINEAVIARG